MGEYYKEKIKNLISLRASLFTIVVVLTGGIYDFVFVSNIFSINNKIDVLLEGLIK